MVSAGIKYQGKQRNLTREQAEAVGLLSIGTFLEYFDLMLYIHMAVLLNELFFPKSDPHTASILSAFAFCATFVFRPIGAVLFGWIGDKVGRKATVVITTFMMAFCCLVMFSLPTYAQIGITASALITICRIVQGMSSLGEVVGAELYLTEVTKPPIQYPVVAAISIFADLGAVFALGVATLVTSYRFKWRYAFLFGAVIAMVGVVARTRLRETPEFADATKRLVKKLNAFGLEKKDVTNQEMLNEKINIKTILAYLSIESTGPICFYFLYMHCSTILKTIFNYTSQQIIAHNLIIAITYLLIGIAYTYLSYKISPLKISKTRLVIFASTIIFLPYLLNNIQSSAHLLLLQFFIVIFGPRVFPATPIFYKQFPVFKRFRCVSISFAVVRAIMFIVTSFGLVYLIDSFGNWGIVILFVPFLVAYGFGLRHFEMLEKLRNV
ncbi:MULTISPECIES: MFS transporter [unclassified Candidatus Tisiphia]|uniref:MFS transporter n=1 Tax=unclassified Candidatus Tisiphia TaxID=2996318 RepID=UPI001E179CA9|nr:MFS transporter [Rickettsia endosymbiont of Sericostoma sp. HW-2014]